MSHSSLDFFRDASDRNYFEMKSVSALLYIESFFYWSEGQKLQKKIQILFSSPTWIIEMNNELWINGEMSDLVEKKWTLIDVIVN